MPFSRVIWILAALVFNAPLVSFGQTTKGVGPAAGTQASPTEYLDRFIKSCDIKSPVFQKLWNTAGLKLSYRGHPVSGILTADADGGSVVRAFFDDVLEADDESGIAELWFPNKQALREAKNASGEVNYSDRAFRLSKREKANMKLVRLVYENPKTGKLVDAAERADYSEAPKSAKWVIECNVSW